MFPDHRQTPGRDGSDRSLRDMRCVSFRHAKEELIDDLGLPRLVAYAHGRLVDHARDSEQTKRRLRQVSESRNATSPTD